MVLDYHKHTREISKMCYMQLGYMHQSRREEKVSDNAYVHGDFLQTSIYKQVTIMHILQDAYTYLEVP